ncbi:hypothetical protein Plhal304r1_c024g0083391 [Plasmopara halstedii]
MELATSDYPLVADCPPNDWEAMVDEPIDSTVNASGSSRKGSGDISMMSPSVPSAPPADPRLSMAEVLRLQEHIRRDKKAVDAARRRVETPKPLVVDIEAIEHQYAVGGVWSLIAPRMKQARPYQLPTAKYYMVIETGKAPKKS